MRSELLQVRITKEVKARLQASADEHGMTLVQYARLVLTRARVTLHVSTEEVKPDGSL